MKKSELKQIIKEEVKKQSDNALKAKLKRALESLKRTGKTTKEEVMSFLEQLLRNIDED